MSSIYALVENDGTRRRYGRDREALLLAAKRLEGEDPFFVVEVTDQGERRYAARVIKHHGGELGQACPYPVPPGRGVIRG